MVLYDTVEYYAVHFAILLYGSTQWKPKNEQYFLYHTILME